MGVKHYYPNNRFVIGDIIKQRFQHNAPDRKVIGYTPSGSISIVWDENERKVMWVNNWAHTRVSHVELGNEERIALLNHKSHMECILGTQYDPSFKY